MVMSGLYTTQKKKLEIRYGTKKAKMKGHKRHNRSFSSMDGMRPVEECLLHDQAELEKRLLMITAHYEIKTPLEKFKKNGGGPTNTAAALSSSVISSSNVCSLNASGTSNSNTIENQTTIHEEPNNEWTYWYLLNDWKMVICDFDNLQKYKKTGSRMIVA